MSTQIENKQLDLHATCTVNVLNAVKIDKVLKFWTELDSRLHVSFVQYPGVMDICNLPDNLKDMIRERCHIGLEYTKQHASNRLVHHATQSVEKIIKWLDKPVNAEFDYLKDLYYE